MDGQAGREKKEVVVVMMMGGDKEGPEGTRSLLA